MVDMDSFSEEARIVWSSLTAKQKEMVQATYPMKAARNGLLCELRAAKVEVQILAEVSGLSRQSISKILHKEAKPDKATIVILRGELKKIQKAVGKLGSLLSRLEKLGAD